jgi:hypothetical protein
MQVNATVNAKLNANPEQWLNTKKNKCSENVLRSHISSCIIAVERGGVRLDDSVI